MAQVVPAVARVVLILVDRYAVRVPMPVPDVEGARHHVEMVAQAALDAEAVLQPADRPAQVVPAPAAAAVPAVVQAVQVSVIPDAAPAAAALAIRPAILLVCPSALPAARDRYIHKINK